MRWNRLLNPSPSPNRRVVGSANNLHCQWLRNVLFRSQASFVVLGEADAGATDQQKLRRNIPTGTIAIIWYHMEAYTHA